MRFGRREFLASVMLPPAFPALAASIAGAGISDAEMERIGQRIWRNECGGRRDGLTSWNGGEQFASLGIGHFIWYPQGKRGPFDEAFPGLAAYLAENGADVPEWVLGQPCPWNTQAEFRAGFQSPRMNTLRELLASTVRLQTAFIVDRMEGSLPKMIAAAPAGQRENVRAQYQRMRGTGAGTFALIDYVNFKGEGIKETERYQGEGWGLLQVLSGMSGKGPGAVREFSSAAARVLTRRVQNSPPARGEKRWLVGWKNRVNAY